ncbi:MAG: site-specific DNA-methyltransferase [Trueperaceae bacterium]|nr:site-specific DNA-methyltransferase [Trueperaceae bacterium]
MKEWDGFDVLDQGELGADVALSSRDAVLLHGDGLRVLEALRPNSVDLVFADPPYKLSNGGFSVHSGRRVPVNKGGWDESDGLDADFAFHESWMGAVHDALKPGGTAWVSGTYHSIYQCGFAAQRIGYRILNDVTWLKPNAPPNLSRRFFTASHETLLWLRKGNDTKHTFHYDLMREGDWASDPLKAPGKQMRSVWSIPAPKPGEKVFGKHPTQKPVALLERVVLASSNPGDLIVDPFSGSATTGIAAVRHHRRFLGIEMDEEFVALAKARLESELGREEAHA